MNIKIDRVQSIEEIEMLSRFPVQKITVSLRDQVEPTRHLGAVLLETLQYSPFQGQLGIYFNPHLSTIEECEKALKTGLFRYIQIDYNQLSHSLCEVLRREYSHQFSFVCDNIIADSDSEPDWVQLSIESAIEWGCELSIINLFNDRVKGWEDFTSGNFDIRISDLKELGASHRIAVCCDFQTSDMHILTHYLESLTLNLKLHNSSQYGHYHTFREVMTILSRFVE